jgi:DNA-binding transcriptional ArsR family regulator
MPRILNNEARVLAHPLRERMLDALRAGTRSPVSMAEEFLVPLPNLCYHLSVLERHGMVQRVGGADRVGKAKPESYWIATSEARRLDSVVLDKIAGLLRSRTGEEPHDGLVYLIEQLEVAVEATGRETV